MVMSLKSCLSPLGIETGHRGFLPTQHVGLKSCLSPLGIETRWLRIGAPRRDAFEIVLIPIGD